MAKFFSTDQMINWNIMQPASPLIQVYRRVAFV